MKLASKIATVVLASSLFISPVFINNAFGSDDDRPAHYKGEASPTLEVAIQNLMQFNKRLEEIISSDEMDIRKIAEVHQLTYTLERALERLEEELETVADTLEEVHVGSERGKFDQVRSAGKEYLEHVRKLFPQTQQ